MSQPAAPTVAVEHAPLVERIAALWERDWKAPALPELPANVARFKPRVGATSVASFSRSIADKPKPKQKPAPRAPRLAPRDDDPQYQLL